MLAILAERAARTPFHELVSEHVIERAGLLGTAYLRSDELPADAALGYLHAADHEDDLRTNVLNLPVIGGGDGGIFTTAGDVVALLDAFDAGRIVSTQTRDEMMRSRTELPDDEGYGLGVRRWGTAIELRGGDAGASFGSVHVPGAFTWAVLSNTTDGAWPVVVRLAEVLLGDRAP